MKLNAQKTILFFLVIILLVAIHVTGLADTLTLENIRTQHDKLLVFYQDNIAQSIVIFFILYVAVTALSLPGAAILTLAGGALMGFWPALITVSFASTIGATLAFLLARYLIGDWVQTKYREKLRSFNEGFEREGLFYLFALRLLPIFPFFLINILMALTPIKAQNFYIVSQIGMLPGTMVYVLAGSELGKIESASDILSPTLIITLALLGVFPLIAKKLLESIRQRRSQS